MVAAAKMLASLRMYIQHAHLSVIPTIYLMFCMAENVHQLLSMVVHTYIHTYIISTQKLHMHKNYTHMYMYIHTGKNRDR